MPYSQGKFSPLFLWRAHWQSRFTTPSGECNAITSRWDGAPEAVVKLPISPFLDRDEKRLRIRITSGLPTTQE